MVPRPPRGAPQQGSGDGKSGSAPPAGIGASVLSLLADEHVPRILRVLRDGPLAIGALQRRLPDLAPSSLDQRLERARAAGAVSRHPNSQAGQPALQKITELGLELRGLFDSAHAWVVQGPGAAADEPGRLSLTALILRTLANDTTRAVFHAVDQGADLPAAIEEELRDAGQVKIGHIVQRQEALRLLEREGRSGGNRPRPIHVTVYGREAVAFVSLAARLEELHAVPGAAPPAPAEAARLLRFAAPLLEPRAREHGALRITIDPHPQRPATPASFLLRIGEDAVVAVESSPDAEVSADARGPVPAWCEAVVEGDRGQLAVTGNAGLAGRLIAELHARLFAGLA